MKFIGKKSHKTALGYRQSYKRYQAMNREGYPMRGPCHKGKKNRIIEVNLPGAQLEENGQLETLGLSFFDPKSRLTKEYLKKLLKNQIIENT